MTTGETILSAIPHGKIKAFFVIILWVVVITVMPVSLSLALDGTPGDDVLTNSDTVDYIDGLAGNDTITNSGTVIGYILGGPGSDTIINSGYVYQISGSRNDYKISGGNNTIINSATVYLLKYVYGSYNSGDDSSGGNNTITNSGAVGFVYGSYNSGDGSSGGNNTITNSGTALKDICGSYNSGYGSGGSNTITNSGTVEGSIYGSRNGSGSSGNNTIINSGTVNGSIYGSSNSVVGNTLELVRACHVGVDIENFERFFKTGAGTATVGGHLNLPSLTQTTIQGFTGYYPAIAANTATLSGDLIPYGYFPTGTVVLIQTNGLASGFTAVIDNSPVLDFTVANNGDNVELTTTRRSYTSVVPGLSGNDRLLADMLSNAAPNAEGDLAFVIGVLDFLSPSNMAAALNQFWPTTLSALHDISFINGSLFIDSIMRRLQDLRVGFQTANDIDRFFADDTRILLASNADTSDLGALRSSRSDKYGLSAFGRILGSSGNRDASSGHPGYQYDTFGFVFGLDHAFGPGFMGGFDVGYVATDIDYKDVGRSSGDVKTLQAGIYGTWLFDSMHMDAAVSGGYNWYESDRRIVFGAVDRTAKADFNGWLVGGHLGAGYDFNPGRFMITPEAAMDYGLLHTHGYKEYGAGDLDLNVDDINTHSLATTLGANMAYPFETNTDLRVVPSISAAWKHEFLGDKDNIQSYFSCMPSDVFFIDTAGPDRDSALVGLALLFKGKRTSVNVRYDAQMSDNFDSHRLSAEIRYAF